MREVASGQWGINARVVWSGVILVVTGLSVLLLVGEWFAMYDACLANPDCNAGVPVFTLESYLAFMVIGVALSAVGVTIIFSRGRGPPKRAMILWL